MPPQNGQCEAKGFNKRPIKLDEAESCKRPATVSQNSSLEVDSSFKTDGTTPDRKLIFIEFCAGSASLSAAMMRAGFHAMPVDFAGNKFTPKVKSIEIDLASQDGKQLATEMVDNVQPFSVHLGLPCGTCSRARELPVSSRLRAKGAPQPPPLRDGEHLMGFEDLRPTDKIRVQLANEIYRTAVAILECCFRVKACVILENPTRSWLWAILAMLVKQSTNKEFTDWYFQMHNVDFSACMHGGERPKATRLRTSCRQLLQLSLECDNSHTHKPWTITLGTDSWNFATAAEAEYPALLSKRIAMILASMAPANSLAYTEKFFRLKSLFLMGKQTTAHQQMIPEFKTIQQLPQAPVGDGFKVLERPDCGGTSEVDDNNSTLKTFRVGWYHSPMEHVDIAIRMDHPCESDAAVPDDLKVALFNVLTKGMHVIAKERTDLIREMINKANDLKEDEAKFKATLDPEVADVVKGKRLLLFRWLLKEIAFEDPVVVDHMEKGVKLVGWESDSPLYTKRCAAPTISERQLDSDAVWRRKALKGRSSADGDSELADQLWEETMKELDAGFLKGPFGSEEEVSKFLGCNDWSLSQRFLLLQGAELKPRVIDNLKESAVNAAFGSTSYLALQDVDFVGGFVSFIARVLASGPDIEIRLNSGGALVGRIHPSFNARPSLVGRAVDLSKAYKQVALHPESRKHSVLGVKKKQGDWAFFVSRSIPFGASASVFSFNKITRALWSALVRKFGLLVCVFFDDFPVFEFEPLQRSTSQLLHSFFDCMGWLHATSGKKAEDFSLSMTVLGVTFDLSQVWDGNVKVANKEGRLERILEVAEALARSKEPAMHDISVLQGLLNFAGGFVAGRAFKPILHFVQQIARSRDFASFKRLHGYIQEVVKVSAPRWIRARTQHSNVIIYTDGAWLPERGVDGATWGGVLLDDVGGHRIIHDGTVPSRMVSEWKTVAGEQIICQIEMYAALLIRFRYRDLLLNRPCIFFIDNEAARIALLKGASPSGSLFRMTHAVSILDAAKPCGVWYERVPSFSNISDLPSRGRAMEAAALVGGECKGDIRLDDSLVAYISSRDPLVAFPTSWSVA